MKKPRSHWWATKPATAQTPRKSLSVPRFELGPRMQRKSFSIKMSLSPQSPVLRAIFRSLRIWSDLAVMFCFWGFFLLFSSLLPKVFWRVQWGKLGCLGGFICLSCGKGRWSESGKTKPIFYVGKKGLFCTNTISAACFCFQESLLTFFTQNTFHSPSNWCLLFLSPTPFSAGW